MEVFDSQVHANQISPRWTTAPLIECVDAAVAAMDAVGIATVLIDEFSGFDPQGRVLPGHEGPNGAWRSTQPFAELAVSIHPRRFAFVTRVDRLDPELDRFVGEVPHRPGCVALRVTYGAGKGTAAGLSRDPAFRQGDYNALFNLAEQHNVPVFLLMGGDIESVVPYLRRFPRLKVILDHCGVHFPPPDVAAPERFAGLQALRHIADFENVAVKWTHVERLSAVGFPFDDVVPHLRTVLGLIGAERIMWASDATQSGDPAMSANPTTWAETLHYLLASRELSDLEKRCLLGDTARRILLAGRSVV
jgi:predicted TIM-barrel fold metal-dependent hydrolase